MGGDLRSDCSEVEEQSNNRDIIKSDGNSDSRKAFSELCINAAGI